MHLREYIYVYYAYVHTYIYIYIYISIKETRMNNAKLKIAQRQGEKNLVRLVAWWVSLDFTVAFYRLF